MPRPMPEVGTGDDCVVALEHSDVLKPLIIGRSADNQRESATAIGIPGERGDCIVALQHQIVDAAPFLRCLAAATIMPPTAHFGDHAAAGPSTPPITITRAAPPTRWRMAERCARSAPSGLRRSAAMCWRCCSRVTSRSAPTKSWTAPPCMARGRADHRLPRPRLSARQRAWCIASRAATLSSPASTTTRPGISWSS